MSTSFEPPTHEDRAALPDEASVRPSHELLPYHLAMREFLQRCDTELWKWFASRQTSDKYAEDVKFDLLKSAYRVERATQPDLYQAADDAAERLGVSAPISIYQAQNPEGLNAGIAYVPSEVHLVLHGPVATQLNNAELRALLGHELSHYQLWNVNSGEQQIVAEVLHALITDAHAHPAHFASWRLLGLYTEIYCDRGAFAVTNDLLSVISMLVKVHTGVPQVDPEAYLRQADEIFAHGETSTAGVTHPEAFVRARALKLWADSHPDAQTLIGRMIEGQLKMDELDLLGQERIAAATRRLLDALLCKIWFQTDAILAHARLFFDDYTPPEDSRVAAPLALDVFSNSPSVSDYFCFVMLDFITVDRQLEDAPIAAALTLAEQLGVKPRFLELARQELRLRKKQLDKLDETKDQILAAADRTPAAKDL